MADFELFAMHCTGSAAESPYKHIGSREPSPSYEGELQWEREHVMHFVEIATNVERDDK